MFTRIASLAVLAALVTTPAFPLDLNKDSKLDQAAMMLVAKQVCSANVSDELLGRTVYVVAASEGMKPDQAGLMIAAKGALIAEALNSDSTKKAAICANLRTSLN